MKASALPFGILRLLLVSGLMALGLSACGGGSKAVGLNGVELTPAAASKPLGTSQQYSATAIYSNNSTADVSGEVSWQSSNPATVSISASGLAQTLRTGTVTISASYLGQSVSTTLTVTAAAPVAVAVTPANSTLAKGSTRAYLATATFTDASVQDVTANASWVSSSTTVATVSNTAGSRGVVTAAGPGSTSISASFQGLSGSTGLTVTPATLVSIQVTPSSSSSPKGTSKQFTATGIYTDSSTQNLTGSASWSSSNPALASISNASASKGLASALAEGAVSISASAGGVVGSTGLTVTAAVLTELQVTPTNASRPKGTSQQFAATGIYSDMSTQDLTSSVVWSSTAADVASISNASGSQGRASALAIGGTTIGAASGDISASTPFTVTPAVLTGLQITPANASVPKGSAQQFTATGTYSDLSAQDLTAAVTWSSSATGVASISNAAGSKGLASTPAVGSATIGAASGDISASTPFTVTAAVLSRIDVTPAEPSIPVGTTQQFTATGVYSDNGMQDLTASATWQSSDTAVLEISNSDGNQGFAVASVKGPATVSASYSGLSGSTLATVSDAALTSIEVSPANGKLAKGFKLQYTATGSFSDGSVADVSSQVTWSSTNTTAASISNADGSRGLATATSTPGTTNISATRGSVVGKTSLTVTNATLSSIIVEPPTPSVPKGLSRQLTATGSFSDGTTQDLSSQASWSSANTARVTVSDSAGSKGLVQAVDLGSATVTAAVGSTSGSTDVTVTAATLNSIAVTPPTTTKAKGTTEQYQADGTYSDGSVVNITASVTWSSSAAAVATISNAGGSKGLATAAGVGDATITAALGSVSGTASFTGTIAELVGIAVTPATPSIAAGRKQQFTATGTYTDGTHPDLTNSVTWSSDTPAVATISNAAGSKGLASSSQKGTSKIVATSGAVSSDAVTLTVTDAVPVSISITPANQTISNKSSLQYKATELFSDGSSSDQTGSVSWTSSDAAIATVSNATGSKGLANAVTVGGPITISATDTSLTPNIVGTTQLTVSPATLQSIKVTGKLVSLPAGYKVQYSAEGTYSDASKQDITTTVSWSTLNSSVATISNTAGSKGVVTTVAVGSTSVVANLSGVTGNAGVTVNTATLSSIAVTPDNPDMVGSATLQFTATATFSDGGKLDVTTQVTWGSDNEQSVSIGATTGLATGENFPGDAVISATKGAVTDQTTVNHTLF
ncbi:MAG: Ig-like domain-containing protein [Stagnimonas sp.]|nr:Ig-like domain-containing protein [Stagnimonas sp.]